MTDNNMSEYDDIPARAKAPPRKRWTREESLAEIERLRADMTPDEIKRVQARLERIRASSPTERKHFADELVWPWEPCPTNGHIGYRFRFRRPNGSMSGIRCRQCKANKPKKKRKQLKIYTAKKSSYKALGAILFGTDNPSARAKANL